MLASLSKKVRVCACGSCIIQAPWHAVGTCARAHTRARIPALHWARRLVLTGKSTFCSHAPSSNAVQGPDTPLSSFRREALGRRGVSKGCVMAVVVFYPPPPAQSSTRRRKEKRLPPRCPSPKILTGVLEALLCASGSDDTLRVERDLHLRLSWIPLLSACRLGGDGPRRERFGKLEHWSALIESTGAESIVLYISAERQFFVVCAKPTNTQPVNTRSAICWLRDAAGLGFCVHDTRGVCRIVVSRRADSDEDPWCDCLARLMAAVPDVFPDCNFDNES